MWGCRSESITAPTGTLGIAPFKDGQESLSDFAMDEGSRRIFNPVSGKESYHARRIPTV